MTIAGVKPVFATVIACHSKGFLFVYNRQKHVWEFPGGWLDPGETARACAKREFQEETCQMIANLNFHGLIKIQPSAERPYLLGALFSGTLDEVKPFTANDEMSKLSFFLGHEHEIDPVDKALLELLSSSL